MPLGDKYINFTEYLKLKHVEGVNALKLPFSEIEKIWGFPISESMYRYIWANDKTQSYSVAWMKAGYVVRKCDLQARTVLFEYNKARTEQILGEQTQSREKVLRVRESKNVCGYLPITEENLERYTQLVQEDSGYGTDNEIIHNVLTKHPLNVDRDIVALKICLIDVTNSTHLGTQRGKISLDELARIIMNIPDFDSRLGQGDPELVNELARSNGKINLFSFASKYCLYHNKEVYGRDDYSIFDSVVAKTLPHYVDGLSTGKIDSWRTRYNYKAFAECIDMILDAYAINIPDKRRKLDLFLWYANRVKEQK